MDKKITTVKKTFLDLRIIDEVIGSVYLKNPKLREAKFGYAYKRFFDKNCAPIFKEYNDELKFTRIDNALENKDTGEILTDERNERGFKFSKNGLKKCIESEGKIFDEFNKKEVDVTPYICASIPSELTDEQKEILKGLLI